MSKRLVVTFLTIFAGGVVPTMLAGSPSAFAARPTASVLYHDTFRSKGLTGWKTSNKKLWKAAKNGVLTFTGTKASQIVAPFSTAHAANFAVVAKIKPLGKATNTFSGYGLVVRRSGSDTSTGILGGSFFIAGDANATEPRFLWGLDDVAGTDVKPKAGYNTYRIDVRGTDYSLSINGKLVVNFVIPDFASGTSIGIWDAFNKIQVKSFRVLNIAATAPPTVLPPVKAINLAPTDVPSSLQPAGGHYSTNEELARLAKVPVSSLVSAGRLIEYQVEYAVANTPTSGVVSVDSFVTAYNSAQNAQAGLTQLWSNAQQTYTGAPNYSAATAVTGVGDEAHQLSFDFNDPSGNSTISGLFFRRGNYTVSVYVQVVQGTVAPADLTKQTVTLGQVVDQRIQQAPQS